MYTYIQICVQRRQEPLWFWQYLSARVVLHVFIGHKQKWLFSSWELSLYKPQPDLHLPTDRFIPPRIVSFTKKNDSVKAKCHRFGLHVFSVLLFSSSLANFSQMLNVNSRKNFAGGLIVWDPFSNLYMLRWMRYHFQKDMIASIGFRMMNIVASPRVYGRRRNACCV